MFVVKTVTVVFNLSTAHFKVKVLSYFGEDMGYNTPSKEECSRELTKLKNNILSVHKYSSQGTAATLFINSVVVPPVRYGGIYLTTFVCNLNCTCTEVNSIIKNNSP